MLIIEDTKFYKRYRNWLLQTLVDDEEAAEYLITTEEDTLDDLKRQVRTAIEARLGKQIADDFYCDTGLERNEYKILVSVRKAISEMGLMLEVTVINGRLVITNHG